MGAAGQSAEVLGRLALIAASYQHDLATGYANKIQEPERRALTFLKLAESQRQAGQPDYDYLMAARKAERETARDALKTNE